jgi:hypothetical protein
MCLPSVIGSLVHITSLAKDVKLSTCGRHSLLCFLFYFQHLYLLVKFGEAFFCAIPELTHPLGLLIRPHCGQCDVLSLGVE